MNFYFQYLTKSVINDLVVNTPTYNILCIAHQNTPTLFGIVFILSTMFSIELQFNIPLIGEWPSTKDSINVLLNYLSLEKPCWGSDFFIQK